MLNIQLQLETSFLEAAILVPLGDTHVERFTNISVVDICWAAHDTNIVQLRRRDATAAAAAHSRRIVETCISGHFIYLCVFKYIDVLRYGLRSEILPAYQHICAVVQKHC